MASKIEFGMSEQARRCYDELAAEYHLIFADWNASIARQAAVIGPHLEREAGGSRSLRILDCACGIGTQALGLAQRGHRITGSDLSAAAVNRARREASDRGLHARFVVADMLDLTPVNEENFDAVVCLDNSLPHLESYEQLCQAAMEIRKKLPSGGVFVASIRDYDHLIQERPAVDGPTFYMDEGKRRIVHQVWDWIDDRRYAFHLYITRQVSTGWESHHYTSTYRALLRNELTSAIQAAGFIDARWMLPVETGFYQPLLVAGTESSTRLAV
jgi:glycine/sarcosine N-methyltransferase